MDAQGLSQNIMYMCSGVVSKCNVHVLSRLSQNVMYMCSGVVSKYNVHMLGGCLKMFNALNLYNVDYIIRRKSLLHYIM